MRLMRITCCLPYIFLFITIFACIYILGTKGKYHEIVCIKNITGISATFDKIPSKSMVPCKEIKSRKKKFLGIPKIRPIHECR